MPEHYSYPLMPNEEHLYDGYKVRPHPDGEPWKKCCGDKNSCLCATRRYNEDHQTVKGFSILKGKSRLEASIEYTEEYEKVMGQSCAPTVESNNRFFCCHRQTEDGFNRVCAGFHVKYRKD